MKKTIISKIAIIGFAGLMLLPGCFGGSTDNPTAGNTVPPECTENSQCTDGKVCVNQTCEACTDNDQCGDQEMCSEGKCITCHCLQMTGYCAYYYVACSAGHFSWTGLGCPGGREGMCCLPTTSCSAIQGICINSTNWNDCPSGYGGYYALDCPQGANGTCCVPLQ